MRRLLPTERDSLHRLGLLKLYDDHHLMFDLLESKSWEELKNVGIVTPSSEDILDALKVRIEHNLRFHTAMKKHRHIRPDFYGNYAEMLGRYIVAKNGSKSHTHP